MRRIHTNWGPEYDAAAAFTFDLDADELWRTKIEADPAWDTPPVRTRGEFGPEIAVPRILELFEAVDRTCTFFVPGIVAENWPETVQTIHDAGHEIAHHGYTHTSPSSVSPEEEEAEFTKALDVFEDVLGITPTGYRCPSGAMSDRTLDLPKKYGMTYDSSYKNRDVPYRHENGLVELPNSRALNDWPQWAFNYSPTLPYQSGVSPNEPVFRSWRGEFDALRERGRLFMLTMHPQMIGTAGRIRLLGGLLDHVVAHDDVLVASCCEIAATWDEANPQES